MSKITEWNIAQKIQASGRRGLIIGIIVGVLFIVAVILAIVKIRLIKKYMCCDCGCGMDDFDEDFYLDDDSDVDENGCVYTSEKDFQ